MVDLKRIKDSGDPSFLKLIPLYLSAFPKEERRRVEPLKQLIEKRAEMYFNAVISDDKLAGLFVYWDFKTFYYIEHLVIFPEMRSRNIGQQVLGFAENHLIKLRLLEVEPAIDQLTTRRVNYYLRNGYNVLDRDYLQPSYDGVRASVRLWIMGNKAITGQELQKYIQIIQKEVYYQNR